MNKITVNGHSVDWTEGMNIRDILRIMNYTFPMLVTKVNGKLVLKADYDSFKVPDGAEVFVIHLISGG